MSIKQVQIKVKKEYYDVVPRPTDTQYESLKESIRESGQQIPIVVNQDGIILDGHTRYEICKELNIEPIHETKVFDDKIDEKNYVIITNLSRRHLTIGQRAELLYSWWVREKEKSRVVGGKRTWKTRRGGKKSTRTHGKLAKDLGTKLGCGHNTAWKLMKIFEKADDKIKEKMKEGSITVASAYNQTMGIKLLPTRIRYPKSYYSNLKQRHKTCLRCGEKTKIVDKKECHVHDNFCCTKCGWGI